jgi:Ni/Fe-hydrogenase 1 B-type cytochrome subunit
VSTAPTARKWVRTADESRIRVYVWDAVIRTTHWLVAGSILVLAVTGLYIARPFASSVGPATPHFFMGWMKTVHSYSAIVFTVSLFARVMWFFIGPKQASWRQFIPTTRERWRNFVSTLRFYLFISVQTPSAVAHNALAGLAYAAVFFLYAMMLVTGFALYGASANVSSPMHIFHGLAPLVGGLQTARLVHHVVMWLILAFVIHHVYSALLTAKLERNGELEAIFSGNKYLLREQLEAGREALGPQKAASENVRT